MRKYLPLVLAAFMLLGAACKKSAADELQETNPTGTKMQMAGFTSNAHTTSGMVSVVESNGRRYLNFENFRTDNGPDLRVYISTNTSATDFQEIGLLKAVNGRFSYELSAGQNTSTRNHVLIWCKSFSVLFGHAVLQ